MAFWLGEARRDCILRAQAVIIWLADLWDRRSPLAGVTVNGIIDGFWGGGSWRPRGIYAGWSVAAAGLPRQLLASGGRNDGAD